jgi:hypothetical protein
MADDQFQHDLERVVHDYAGAEPPAGLDEWLSDLPAIAARRQRSLVRFVRPVAATVALLVISALVMSVYWARSGPAALPSGQTLTIVTEPASSADAPCLMALLRSAQMRRSGPELVFSQNGQRVEVVWPYGTTALLVNGEAELFAPDGSLIAIEGQTLPDLTGGLGSADDRFHVCQIGSRSWRMARLR